jgi:hypothetical protein
MPIETVEYRRRIWFADLFTDRIQLTRLIGRICIMRTVRTLWYWADPIPSRIRTHLPSCHQTLMVSPKTLHPKVHPLYLSQLR